MAKDLWNQRAYLIFFFFFCEEVFCFAHFVTSSSLLFLPIFLLLTIPSPGDTPALPTHPHLSQITAHCTWYRVPVFFPFSVNLGKSCLNKPCLQNSNILTLQNMSVIGNLTILRWYVVSWQKCYFDEWCFSFSVLLSLYPKIKKNVFIRSKT